MLILVENVKAAFDALNTNRLRTFLTLLGIVIGVAAVIMIGGASRSGKAIIFQELETFGLKSLWVYRSYKDSQPGKTLKQGSGIDNDDIDAIARECNLIKRISPVVEKKRLWAKYGNNYFMAKLLAVDFSYGEINNDSIIRGRPILLEDVKFRRDVCIIGVKVVERLFGREESIGKEIRIGNYKYTVVGILKEKDRDFLASIGSAGGQDANDRVIIPISVYQRQYNTKEIDYIQAEALNVSIAKKAAEDIKDILNRRHKDEYRYQSETMQQYIETTDTILRIVSWIGGMAAMISLVVGGIGIMNIMTASVLERIKEIGIKKALGARKVDILIHFLTESVFISLFGGVIGTILGISCILVIELLSNKPALLAPEYVIVSLVVSILVGILSGVYPAMRAASMDPVEALRFE